MTYVCCAKQKARAASRRLCHWLQCALQDSGWFVFLILIYCINIQTFPKFPLHQETALPTLLADPPQNMIAQSQSGTGKTAAFVLAMLSRVDATKPYPQVLCLSPTYELAIQTGEVAAKMGQFCPEIKIRFAVRGEERKLDSGIQRDTMHNLKNAHQFSCSATRCPDNRSHNHRHSGQGARLGDQVQGD